MAGSVPIRAGCFVMLAACGALCQQRQMKASSLPDAPVVQASEQANLDGSAQFGNFVLAQFVALPSIAPSKACQYALGLWKKLTASWRFPN